MSKASTLKTLEVMTLLRLRYEMPAYALLENVANGVGLRANGRRRFADALAIEQFGSSGHHLHGFEVKVSRSDWLRELKDETKADSVYRYCDYWWIVVGDPSIVKDGELPAGWGLLYPRGNCLVAKADAARQRDVCVHDRAFVAAIFRRAREQQIDKQAMAAEYHRGHEAGAQLTKHINKARIRDLETSIADLRKQIADYEEATGVKIGDRYGYGYGTTAGDLGRAVRLLVNGERDVSHTIADLARLRQSAEQVVRHLDQTIGPKKPAPGEVVAG